MGCKSKTTHIFTYHFFIPSKIILSLQNTTNTTSSHLSLKGVSNLNIITRWMASAAILNIINIDYITAKSMSHKCHP